MSSLQSSTPAMTSVGDHGRNYIARPTTPAATRKLRPRRLSGQAAESNCRIPHGCERFDIAPHLAHRGTPLQLDRRGRWPALRVPRKAVALLVADRPGPTMPGTVALFDAGFLVIEPAAWQAAASAENLLHPGIVIWHA
jgi:hypothetical protein